MEKKNIETFIKKYSLGGLINEVRWKVKDKSLKVSAMTTDKKFISSVLLKKFEAMDDATLGIIDSTKLKQLLGALGENITIVPVSDEEDAARIRSLILSDDKSELTYATADLDVIKEEPKLKSLPVFGVEIKMNEEFVELFNKTKSALSESELFTLSMSKKKKKLEMVFGHGKNNINRLAFEVPTVDGKDTVKAPISFSAKALKEIISANSEAKDPVLKVSEDGLASVECDVENFQSQYYMVRVDVED
jgi:hypothetical protein